MIFNIDEYKSASIQKVLKKINQIVSKNKMDKFLPTVDELEPFLNDVNSDECRESVLVYSLLLDEHPEILKTSLSKHLNNLIYSSVDETRLNGIILYGTDFIKRLHSDNQVNGDNIDKFIDIGLNDKVPEIQSNVIFFVEQFPEEYFTYILPKIDKFLNLFKQTNNSEVMNSIINIIGKIWDKSLDIKLNILEKLQSVYLSTSKVEKETAILNFIKSSINEVDILLKDNPKAKKEEIIKTLKNRGPLIKLYDLEEIAKEEGMNFKDVEQNFNKLTGDDLIFRFPYQDKKKYFIEIEIKPLLELLQRDKVKVDDLIKIFGDYPIDTLSLIDLLIKKLVKAKNIKGYLTKSYFYSYNYLKEQIMNDIKRTGIVNLDEHSKQVNYNFILSIAEEINKESKFNGIFTKNKSLFRTLNSLIKEIEKSCIKDSMFDLSYYKETFLPDDYQLIENECKTKLFTKYHLGSNWLTHIGFTRLTNLFKEGQNMGFINLPKIVQSTEIPLEISKEILNEWLENKPGIWDKSESVFYFIKYIKLKVGNLFKSNDTVKLKEEINKLASTLNLDPILIEKKLNQEKADIISQIKEKPSIDINMYTNALGMGKADFIKFVNELNIDYLIEGNNMIFDKSKIEKRRKEVKDTILSDAEKRDYLDVVELSKRLRIGEQIIFQTIKGLYDNQKQDKEHINGILIDDGLFITKQGIIKRILQNKEYISASTIIGERELTPDEQNYVIGILKQLIDEGKLVGTFDESSQEFKTEDLKLFKTFMDSKANAEDLSKLYIKYMRDTFKQVRDIFMNNETLKPGDLKRKDFLIKRVIEEFQNWEHNLNESIKNAEKSFKDIENLDDNDTFADLVDFDKKETKKIDSQKILGLFGKWKQLIIDLEQHTPALGALKKKLKDNPEDAESKSKYDELIKKLHFDEKEVYL